ncbi:Granule-bound starch synthase [Musa troglodytarum]|uniref:Granule-bound starch synthase n=1 Tax=Musa troglodytarum TaxID=320322 RepID=A0A9E7E939_9LILI|nr:Granule-bound starch synthase [Musa troglodytarum]
MIQNCMDQDLSWKGPAKEWEQLFLSLGDAGTEPGINSEEIAPLAKENVAAPRKCSLYVVCSGEHLGEVVLHLVIAALYWGSHP